MGGTGADQGSEMARDPDGNVYVVGIFSANGANFNPGGSGGALTSAGNTDGFLLKFSQTCVIHVTATESSCDSFVFNGVKYTTGGIYRDTFTTANNCDSIVTLDLDITGYSSSNPVVTGSYCDSVKFNGHTYTASGTYVQHYQNASGCDSNITYVLHIEHSTTHTLTETACDSFAFNGMVYTSSGVYTAHLTNAHNCDSAVTLHLTIHHSPDATITNDVSILTASDGDSYLWIDCADGSPIPGAAGRTYVPLASGLYRVQVTKDGCSDTSDCVTVNLGINTPEYLREIYVYPNPTGDRLTIRVTDAWEHAVVRLITAEGLLLAEVSRLQGNTCTLDLRRYAAGMYSVEIREQGRSIRWKVAKH
jgi:hypothetical protein